MDSGFLWLFRNQLIPLQISASNLGAGFHPAIVSVISEQLKAVGVGQKVYLFKFKN